MEILLVGAALAMDAFAVSLCFAAASNGRLKPSGALEIAGFFGIFQAAMPCLGWLTTNRAHGYIESFDHWIAFALLVYIGARMVAEAVKADGKSLDKKICPRTFNIKILFALAVATSIDAFAVGISFGCLNRAILKPALIIGVETFLISLFGAVAGGKTAKFAKDKAEIFGGVLLIAIGVKILAEHLFFGK